MPYGSGTVRTAHGLLPVPAPATLKLMLGLPTRPGPPNASGELCTPTGVALLRSLAPDLALSWASGRPPLGFIPTHVGLGAGSKNFPGHPNVVRAVIGRVPNGTGGGGARGGGASVGKVAAPIAAASGASTTTTLPKATSGEPSSTVDHGHNHAHGSGAGPGHHSAASSSTSSASANAAAALGSGVGVGTTSDGAVSSEEGSGGAGKGSHDWDTSTLFVVEANLDDMPAENLAYAVQKLLDAGALDAWTSVRYF